MNNINADTARSVSEDVLNNKIKLPKAVEYFCLDIINPEIQRASKYGKKEIRIPLNTSIWNNKDPYIIPHCTEAIVNRYENLGYITQAKYGELYLNWEDHKSLYIIEVMHVMIAIISILCTLLIVYR